MKKIIFLLLVLLMSMACDTDRGMTQRTRCESNVGRSQSVEDPESCVLYLSVFSRRKDTVPEIQAGFDSILIQCLNYNYEMSKCEKKSNLLPP